MSAAPIDIEHNQNHNQNHDIINKKRHAHPSHVKTQKHRNPSSEFNSQKVNSVLQSIHNNTSDDDELGHYNPNGSSASAKHSDDFKPLNPYEFPTKPVSVGGERTKKMEGMTNNDNLAPKPVDDDDLDLQELQTNFMNDAQVRDYYRKLVPNYKPEKEQHNRQYHTATEPSTTSSPETNQVLIDKLNYMINLLEEQQDQRTGNITEEVVLYSFLGVFIIFVVDSFARVGKYVR